MSCESNRKAKENGDKAEALAQDFLKHLYENVIYTNDIFDFIIHNNIPIEVKSCNYKIFSADRVCKWRFGRFCLDREQHQKLIEENGFYLFIVRLPCASHLIFLMPASWVKYRPRPSWRRVYFEYLEKTKQYPGED